MYRLPLSNGPFCPYGTAMNRQNAASGATRRASMSLPWRPDHPIALPNTSLRYGGFGMGLSVCRGRFGYDSGLTSALRDVGHSCLWERPEGRVKGDRDGGS